MLAHRNKSSGLPHLVLERILFQAFILFVLSCAASAAFPSAISTFPGATSTGTISLPPGEVAPAGGLMIEIVLDEHESSGYVWRSNSTTVLIATGLNSASYTITIPDYMSIPFFSMGYAISYRCYNCRDYVQQGYQNSSGTQEELNSGFFRSAEQIAVSELQLIPAVYSFSGAVTLPLGYYAPPGGMSLEVVLSRTLNPLVFDHRVNVFIPEGSNTANYFIGMPSFSGYIWTAYATVIDCGNCPNYFPGYYKTNGATGWRRDATLLPGRANLADINLSPLVGKMIGGTISFPVPDVAPDGGHSFEVIVSHYDNGTHWISNSAMLTIPSGGSTIQYEIPVPPDVPLHRVEMHCLETTYACRVSYYNSIGSQFDIARAEFFQGNTDYANINIDFITYSDSDLDGDQVPDEIDNCPSMAGSQQNIDGDAFGYVCDPDRDNDGVENENDSNQYDPKICRDTDFDLCDDCSIGTDGFGILADSDSLNDGKDTDTDGICNFGDSDDDGDLVPDLLDNCPLIYNEDQLDICTFCFPIVSKNGAVTVCM